MERIDMTPTAARRLRKLATELRVEAAKALAKNDQTMHQAFAHAEHCANYLAEWGYNNEGKDRHRGDVPGEYRQAA